MSASCRLLRSAPLIEAEGIRIEIVSRPYDVGESRLRRFGQCTQQGDSWRKMAAIAGARMAILVPAVQNGCVV